ncbi:MAG: amidohydrolase family protein, partial [Planctomycetota bacterium]
MSALVITNVVLGLSGATGSVRVEDGRITELGQHVPTAAADEFDATGRCLLPGFVDCHTHACWAGSRLDEWERCLAGATYLEVLDSGGGIMSTVRAVRAATEAELTDRLLERLTTCLRHGTTTIEVKSGYGLTTKAELKMLAAIHQAAESFQGTIVPTACIGHCKDPEQGDEHVRTTIEQTLPAVSETFPGITIDAYCEKGAWSLSESLALFDAALEAGHPVRVHADQFNDLGMIPEA